MPDSPTPSKKLCVFCGSSSGFNPVYADAARQLGAAIGAAGHHLVYGGGHVGLMGIVADAVMETGAEVTGVMTEQLVALEVAHQGLTTLDVQPDMHPRKARMAELADGVIALPGGFGTLDETFEILTWNQLGLVSTPVVFLNVDGYYDRLFEFVERMTTEGFMKPDHQILAQQCTDAATAVEIAAGAAPDYTPKWVG